MNNFGEFPKFMSPHPKHTGKIGIGDYLGGGLEVVQILGGEGSSGMGTVCVCFDHDIKETFALKTFQDRYANSEAITERFKREALAWVCLEKHPNIVRAFAVLIRGYRGYRPFIMLEFIAPDKDGRNTLAHHLGDTITLKQALEWSIQFCHGMEYAASQGVTVHRDIKPDNIMITKEGTLKISDFGLAKIWDQTEVKADVAASYTESFLRFSLMKTSDGRIVAGAPPWMAPEQFEGNSSVRSDIYSFGVVLFQMVNNGRLPFNALTCEDYFRLHKQAPVPLIETRLYPIIEKCLRKNSEVRYSNFGELRIDLEEKYRDETGLLAPVPPEKEHLNPWEIMNKGTSFASLGLRDDAIREYRRVLILASDPFLLAATHRCIGGIYSDQGKLDAAIGHYQKSLTFKPDLYGSHWGLGYALMAKGMIDEAIQEFREALRLDETAEAHYGLAEALWHKDMLDEAIQECNSALIGWPDYAQAHHLLGILFYKKGLLNDAIKEYYEALKITPNDGMANFRLGVALADKQQIDDAIEYFEIAVDLMPENTDAHINLGAALGSKGLIDEAVIALREAVRLSPEDSMAHFNLGLICLRKNHPDSAINEFKVALRLRPDYIEAHYNLVNILAGQGRIDEAIEAYHNFANCAPPEYSEIIEEMRLRIHKIEGK